MQGFGGANIHLLNGSSTDDTIRYLKAVGIIGVIPRAVHMTNGTYTLPISKIVPTTLAGFACINQKLGFFSKSDVIMIAFNSDKSMRNSYVGRPNQQKLNDELESEEVRAKKVLLPLSEYFVGHDIVGVFYDEETPLELFTAFKRAGLNMKTIHKHGYGTNPDDKPIIGAGFFERVFAFPLLGDERPVMHNETRVSNGYDVYPKPEDVIKLWEEKLGGLSYLSTDGRILFPAPSSLLMWLKDVRRAELKPNP